MGDQPQPVRAPATSLKIARILGIEVRVHWSFSILLILIVALDAGSGIRAVGAGLLWILAILSCVLVHELAHCVVAQRDGVVVDDILLLPIGGVSQMRSIPTVAKEELTIAIVGPLTSIGLALCFGVACLLVGQQLFPPTLLGGSWLARLAWLNLLLGGFNLLPALPMDGGRVLRAALSLHEDRRSATRTAARVARVIAIMMIAAGLAWDFWLVLIGAFVLFAAGAEEQASLESDEQGPSGSGG